MQILNAEGTEIASATTGGEKGGPIVLDAKLGETPLPQMTVALSKADDVLVAHVESAGILNFDVAVSKEDVKAMVPAMGKDSVGFLMNALLHK